MIEYGLPPSADEIEITLFGPGYGEAIAVHLGENNWVLIDSCINPDTKNPASIDYLDSIGVDENDVLLLVATHWHDDHVKGFSDLAGRYPNAEIVISAALNDKEAISFLSAYSGTNPSELTRGTKELYNTILSREKIFYALHRSNLLEKTINGYPVRLTALSPLPSAYSKFIAHMEANKAALDSPITNAPSELKPNIESIAIHIEFDGDAILLGADLEESSDTGWSAIVNDSWSGDRPHSSIYKVAHHGSDTGHCDEVWKKMLIDSPTACLTPFVNGKHKLPNDNDVKRIKFHAKDTYITSAASRKPKMDSRIMKRLSDICENITLKDTTFGALRLRKKITSDNWLSELFGAAQKL